MASTRAASLFIVLMRDRGSGRVTIDGNGNPVWTYARGDVLDQRLYRQGQAELVKMHDAAGADAMYTYHRTVSHWKRNGGEDADTFARRLHDAPLDPYEVSKFSAHQMGSARMGKDPRASVANPWGELHDTRGVWIDDASAFPSASGTNPMATIMALARRTAQAIAAAS
jgi:choline dehydrogenase-like flavoprotein